MNFDPTPTLLKEAIYTALREAEKDPPTPRLAARSPEEGRIRGPKQPVFEQLEGGLKKLEVKAPRTAEQMRQGVGAIKSIFPDIATVKFSPTEEGASASYYQPSESRLSKASPDFVKNPVKYTSITLDTVRPQSAGHEAGHLKYKALGGSSGDRGFLAGLSPTNDKLPSETAATRFSTQHFGKLDPDLATAFGTYAQGAKRSGYIPWMSFAESAKEKYPELATKEKITELASTLRSRHTPPYEQYSDLKQTLDAEAENRAIRVKAIKEKLENRIKDVPYHKRSTTLAGKRLEKLPYPSKYTDVIRSGAEKAISKDPEVAQMIEARQKQERVNRVIKNVEESGKSRERAYKLMENPVRNPDFISSLDPREKAQYLKSMEEIDNTIKEHLGPEGATAARSELERAIEKYKAAPRVSTAAPIPEPSAVPRATPAVPRAVPTPPAQVPSLFATMSGRARRLAAGVPAIPRVVSEIATSPEAKALARLIRRRALGQ